MLQRAESNRYSWWWASHIKTKQSKWLDSNLREMEDTVKQMLKLVETDADSFAKRAELYFKRRPELITHVEDAYRAYRALAERYDRISGELHKANHTIATAFPEQVQYAMLEEEEDKAITPIDPSRINKRTVEGLMKKRSDRESSIRKTQNKRPTSPIDKEKAQEEINKLQKVILVLQTEKEFIRSSYENGIAKYWEVEKQIMDMLEEICCMQDEFDTSAVIEDEEVHALTTATTLKSCVEAIIRLQKQRMESLGQAKLDSERIKVAKEKLKALKSECHQSEMENAKMSSESTEMSFPVENMDEEFDSLNKARVQLESIYEKVKEHFEMNPESSVELEEKINELVNKVTTLELTVSSQAVQINRLTSESDELEKNLQNLEDERMILISDPNLLTERLKEAEEELSRGQAIKKIIQDEEINFREIFTDASHSLNGISEKMQLPKPLENACNEDAFPVEEAANCSTEPVAELGDNEETEIHDIEEDLIEEIHATQQLGHFLQDFFQAEADYLLKSDPEMIEDLTEIGELKNVIAMKDEEIRLLRQQLANVKMSSNSTQHCQQTHAGTFSSAMVRGDPKSHNLQMPGDLTIECTNEGDLSVEFTDLQFPVAEGSDVECITEPKSISSTEEKLRRDINTFIDENLEFWLRFSTSFHHIQEFKVKYADLQADIGKLKVNKTQEHNDTASGDRTGKPESAPIGTRLGELKTELQVWMEHSAPLIRELQSRFSFLHDMQKEISSVVNTYSATGEALFTPCEAARLQGEVMNMKQENNKAARELQMGLDQVRWLQAEIEEQMAKLNDYFEAFVLKNSHDDFLKRSPSRSGVPLEVFLYGSKPKRPSIFARMHPVFKKKHSKLRSGHR
ncbi:protein NETWORKED 2D [Musa acuminata AAA Group]|uniref:protein NETWORKED 2D-like n=1 Tax=Musa acuminata AAA Group TaxID=214697 RepID=UPI0031E196B2